MKKFISVLLTLVLISTMIFVFSACKKEDEGWKKIKVANANLYSDNGYIDYAKDVYLDPNNPHFTEMGMFWLKWDEASKTLLEIPADSAEGAALIDVSKPTMINVHGMLGDGYKIQERYILNNSVAVPTEWGLETDYVPMNLIWINKGWNVGVFHYNRFGTETDTIGNPKAIESKIWSIDSDFGMRYQTPEKNYVYDATQYTIAEHFAAEYIRAMNLLPKEMGNNEIRLIAHSMGGEVTSAGLFLLTELADCGQIPNTKLPIRYANMDGYFSANIGNSYIGPRGITIRWSNKGLVENNTANTVIECIKEIAANNIIIEYYSYTGSALNMGIPAPLKEILKENCVYVEINPIFVSNADGHNGVREWYQCSIYNDPVKDISGGTTNNIAACASTPTDVLRTLKGVTFIITDGQSTVSTKDDRFIRAE